MSKIGIMSMQRIVNYGSFLQAYGLKSIINDIGHEVQFVDYHKEKSLIATDKKSNYVFLQKLDKVIEVFKYDAPFFHKLQYIRYKKNFAKKYDSLLELTNEYNYLPKLDSLIIGSDEVFNCVQKNPNVGYSLELFGKNNKAKQVVTYAASFGNTTLKKLQDFGVDEEIATLLDQMKYISVRDKNSGEIVKELTGKGVFYNLDPVLIYDFVEKCNLIPSIEKKEDYLILYAYSGRISAKESKFISSYAKRKKLKIYAIGGVQSCADKFIDCSPFELFSYFKNANEIITDTFHGTIFSVVTNKPFATIIRKSVGNSYGNEEKLMDLLNRLGLSSRSIYSIEKLIDVFKNEINYEDVNKIICFERIKSYEYLNKVLKM